MNTIHTAQHLRLSAAAIVAAIVVAACSSGDTTLDTIATAPPATTIATITLPEGLPPTSIGKQSGIGNMAPGSSMTLSGHLDANTVDIYLLEDEPGDGTTYEIALSSTDGPVSMAVYDADGATVFEGPGGFALDASGSATYTIFISADAEATYELTVTGTN